MSAAIFVALFFIMSMCFAGLFLIMMAAGPEAERNRRRRARDLARYRHHPDANLLILND
jgi:hypothetical protein